MSHPESTAPEPASQPSLTPQFCLNTTALRDFLRLSRATVDDSISSHLNSLLTPSRTQPFTDTAARPPPGARSRQNIPEQTCNQFKSEILFPSWRSREDVLQYCSKVADTPASKALPGAPTASTPAVGGSAPAVPLVSSDTDNAVTPAKRTSQNYWGVEQEVNERLDPYSARDYSYTRETAAQVLKDVLANEAGVERIVRARTWSVLQERCLGGVSSDGWEETWKAFVKR